MKKRKSGFFNRGIIQLPVLIIAGIALAATVLPLVLNQVQKRQVTKQRAEGLSNCDCQPAYRQLVSNDPEYCTSTYSSQQFICSKSYIGDCGEVDFSWKVAIIEGKCYIFQYYCSNGGIPLAGNCSGQKIRTSDITDKFPTQQDCFGNVPVGYCYFNGSLYCPTGQADSTEGFIRRWEDNKCLADFYRSVPTLTPTLTLTPITTPTITLTPAATQTPTVTPLATSTPTLIATPTRLPAPENLGVTCAPSNTNAHLKWDAVTGATSYRVGYQDHPVVPTGQPTPTPNNRYITDIASPSADLSITSNLWYGWWVNALAGDRVGETAHPSAWFKCPAAVPTNTPVPTAKTCQVTVSSASVAVGGGLTVTATGVGNLTGGEPVRLYVERSDGGEIPLDKLPVGATKWTSTQTERNYYKLGQCTSTSSQECSVAKNLNSLPVGDYQAHCDLPTDPPSKKCSGNPSCDFTLPYETGMGKEDCTLWVRCSDDDNKSFSVGFLWQEEAEEGTVTAPMVRYYMGGSGASDCGFITSPIRNQGKATYSFSVPAAGNYYLWARIKGTSWDNNSFFFSFDNQVETAKHLEMPRPDSVWHWERVVAAEDGSSAVNSYLLTVGNHTLIFGGREVNSSLDKIVLTNDPDYIPTEVTPCGGPTSPAPTLTPSPTPSFFIERKEAESGTLTDPMNAGNDTLASACHYVSAPVSNSGAVVYSFNVPDTGNYYLWARSKGTDWTHNSFNVSFDGGAAFRYEISQFGGSWQWGWEKVKDADASPSSNEFTLIAGIHTLRFAGREPQSKLDEVLLTDSETYIPDFVESCGGNPTPTTTPIPDESCSCPAGMPLKTDGNADCDTDIDGADFEIWRQEFRGLRTTTEANFNCEEDAVVSGADFEIWRSHRQ